MEYIGDILYDDVLLAESGRLIIFGAGAYGRRILHYLERNGVKKNIICFCDSNDELSGKEVEVVPVCYVGGICRRHSDATYLVAGKYSKEMYQILKEKGIQKTHVLFV